MIACRTAPATLTDAKQAHHEPALFSKLSSLPKFGLATHNAARFTPQQQLIVDPVHEKNLSQATKSPSDNVRPAVLALHLASIADKNRLPLQ